MMNLARGPERASEIIRKGLQPAPVVQQRVPLEGVTGVRETMGEYDMTELWSLITFKNDGHNGPVR